MDRRDQCPQHPEQKIDSHRFRDAIRAAINERGSGIKEHKRFTKWASKIDATPAPAVDPLKPSVKKKRTASGAGGAWAFHTHHAAPRDASGRLMSGLCDE